MMRYSSGQSLAEYAIIAGVVAVASIGTIMVSGNALAVAGPDILDEIFGGDSNNSAGPIAGGPAVSIAGTTPIAVTLASGAKITLPSYPTNLAQSVETSGANGTSETILAAMEATIQQLIDAGEIDVVQASFLRNLGQQRPRNRHRTSFH